MINPDLFPDFLPGTVWLAGAGPGDPSLLTLLAHHGLERADIVIYDALVDERILAMANSAATCEYAGKRGGQPSVKQADISDRLVALARDGKRVLRLKGGDPFVFGRGAQECEALLAAGVNFRIVPGITAGIGGLAYAGIPVTSRDTNAAVTFITGHTSGGDIPDSLDWESLSKGSPVLVIYMGSRHLARISERLMAAGRPSNEPVALISKATTPDQKTVTTTLRDCVAHLKEHDLQPPMLIVVGPTVAYGEKFNGRAI
ncbi:MAG: uroporphyrinogen-III C-methyltransferase [Proteobacteria bacterium]|nr:uroporphyrinogen-III C-methyltransferase [Pseudomonadota bacterium]